MGEQNKISFTKEHKVRHEEWDEVTFSADDFFELYPHLLDEDGYIDWSIPSPTFNFDKGSHVWPDEMWGVKDGKVYTSSFASGVMNWNGDEYVMSVHGQAYSKGQLISVEFTLDEDLKKILMKIGAIEANPKGNE